MRALRIQIHFQIITSFQNVWMYHMFKSKQVNVLMIFALKQSN
jgi:hypothetical protein